MKKKWLRNRELNGPGLKLLRIMKLTFIILLATFAQLSASVYSQQTRLSLSLEEVTVGEVLKDIEANSEFFFLYKNDDIDLDRAVSIDVHEKTIDYILKRLFDGSEISYKIIDRQIVLFHQDEALQPGAQPQSVKGKVNDQKGDPVPGVTVMEKGTNNGVIADMNGDFSITLITENPILVFSFVGMRTQEIAVGNQSEINVVMQEEVVALVEVVAIGYGSARKKDITGSVANVSLKEFQKGPVTNVEQLIANKIPGVQVIPSSGKPGAGSSFVIRGGASLNAGNDPLIVIDGVPIEGWGDGPGFLSSLNPNDIESFTVLKDASAAAIYGSRASNGVILITTSKGAKGPVKLNFSSKTSVSKIYKKVPVLNGDEYREVAHLAAMKSGKTYESFGLGTENTDWQDEIYRLAMGTDNNLSFSGGIKNLPYRFSIGYLNQNGILKTSNYERVSAILNLNPTFFDDYLKINLSLKGTSEKERKADERAINSAVSFDPTQPVKVDTSHFGGYFEYESQASNPANLGGHLNPLGMLEQVNSRNEVLRSIGNIQIDYKFHFLPDLHFNINTGYDLSRNKTSYRIPETAFEQNIAGGNVFKANPASEVQNTFFESYLNYARDLKFLSSRVDAMAGYSYNDFMTTNYNYPTYNVYGEMLGSAPTYAFDKPRHTLISFYARGNYFILNKYLFTTTVRRDGSSRFSPKNRWGVFPSYAFAWKLKEEKFLKDVKVVSELKLRLGYGVTGQQDGIGNYDYLPTYSQTDMIYSYLIDTTHHQLTYPSAYDPDRKWEQTATTNIALDYGFFENRLNGSIDVYYKKTTDLLNTINIPLGTNFTNSLTKNIGSMENKGIEFNLMAKPIVLKDFQWDLGFNFSYNKNKITKLSMVADSSVGLVSGNYLVNTVGYGKNVFYLYHQIYDQDGNPIEETVLDANNDGTINDKDRYRSESSVPKYIIGFNTNFTYKKWMLSLAMHANIGHYMYYRPNDNMVAVYGWLVPYNLNRMYYDSKFENNGNQVQNYSDYYLQNASFLKLDNINLSYDFGKVFKSFQSDASLKLTASVQNVFTWTKYTGQDPEASWNYGVDFGVFYPRSRIYAFGINLDF